MKKSILFVCMGNICRSPSAEAVFKNLVEKRERAGAYFIDSAGTIAHHAGEPADARMKTHAAKRGIKLTSIARAFDPSEDFDKFDMIIAMDDENLADLKRMARNLHDEHKISKMTDYSRKFSYNTVPDPYYGGDQGFELVLDLLEDACEGLLDKLEENE